MMMITRQEFEQMRWLISVIKERIDQLDKFLAERHIEDLVNAASKDDVDVDVDVEDW